MLRRVGKKTDEQTLLSSNGFLHDCFAQALKDLKKNTKY